MNLYSLVGVAYLMAQLVFVVQHVVYVGCWGAETIQALSRLATHLSTRQGHPKSLVCNEIYGRLSLALVRANSQAILSHSL